jgi:hypothetical protein
VRAASLCCPTLSTTRRSMGPTTLLGDIALRDYRNNDERKRSIPPELGLKP